MAGIVGYGAFIPRNRVTTEEIARQWGKDPKTGNTYWNVRNSWGEYWGEMGYFRLKAGENQIALEGNCAWATPGTWTEHNRACFEDGSNCLKNGTYVDPGHQYL